MNKIALPLLLGPVALFGSALAGANLLDGAFEDPTHGNMSAALGFLLGLLVGIALVAAVVALAVSLDRWSASRLSFAGFWRIGAPAVVGFVAGSVHWLITREGMGWYVGAWLGGLAGCVWNFVVELRQSDARRESSK